MDRMGVPPTLPVQVSINFGTILNFDEHGDGDVTCKQILLVRVLITSVN